MFRWHTEKRWKYKGRTCEIQQAALGDAVQYRGLVELETDVPADELDAADLRHTRRPKRHQHGENSVWVYRSWSGVESANAADAAADPLASRREQVEALAERVASETR